MKTGYDSLEEAYKDLMPEMISYARGRLVRSDFAIDAAHDAFNKAVEYQNKNPGSKVKSFILIKELKRAIRRLNKRHSIEVCAGDLNLPIKYAELVEDETREL